MIPPTPFRQRSDFARHAAGEEYFRGEDSLLRQMGTHASSQEGDSLAYNRGFDVRWDFERKGTHARLLRNDRSLCE